MPRLHFSIEDEYDDSKLYRNVGTNLPNYKASHPIKNSILARGNVFSLFNNAL